MDSDILFLFLLTNVLNALNVVGRKEEKKEEKSRLSALQQAVLEDERVRALQKILQERQKERQRPSVVKTKATKGASNVKNSKQQQVTMKPISMWSSSHSFIEWARVVLCFQTSCYSSVLSVPYFNCQHFSRKNRRKNAGLS